MESSIFVKFSKTIEAKCRKRQEKQGVGEREQLLGSAGGVVLVSQQPGAAPYSVGEKVWKIGVWIERSADGRSKLALRQIVCTVGNSSQELSIARLTNTKRGKVLLSRDTSGVGLVRALICAKKLLLNLVSSFNRLECFRSPSSKRLA